jgi:hypothetical protein
MIRAKRIAFSGEKNLCIWSVYGNGRNNKDEKIVGMDEKRN